MPLDRVRLERLEAALAPSGVDELDRQLLRALIAQRYGLGSDWLNQDELQRQNAIWETSWTEEEYRQFGALLDAVQGSAEDRAANEQQLREWLGRMLSKVVVCRPHELGIEGWNELTVGFAATTHWARWDPSENILMFLESGLERPSLDDPRWGDIPPAPPIDLPGYPGWYYRCNDPEGVRSFEYRQGLDGAWITTPPGTPAITATVPTGIRVSPSVERIRHFEEAVQPGKRTAKENTWWWGWKMGKPTFYDAGSSSVEPSGQEDGWLDRQRFLRAWERKMPAVVQPEAPLSYEALTEGRLPEESAALEELFKVVPQARNMTDGELRDLLMQSLRTD